MPLRCCAVLSYSSAMHHTAMPRPSCSSLSYSIATLAASVLCYCCGSLLHALLRLCNASSISSMLRRCGRSLAMLCRRIVPLCYAIAARSLAFPLLLIAKPLPCLSLPLLAVPLQCVSLPFPALPSPRESSQCLAIAPLVVSNQRHAFSDRGSVRFCFVRASHSWPMPLLFLSNPGFAAAPLCGAIPLLRFSMQFPGFTSSWLPIQHPVPT